VIGVDPDDDLQDDDVGKGDVSGLPGFVEVDADHSSASFRRYVGRALVILRDHDTQIGRLTYDAIKTGRVRIDELADLTCWDFSRVRRDMDEEGVHLTAEDFSRLHDRDSPVLAAVSSSLDGYMWGNRIYVSRGQTSHELAVTLVHEVNHVLNRSEVGYYDDLPSSAFREEYRAFHAERSFAPENYEGVDLVDYVITLYDLDRTKIAASLLGHPVTPRILPTANAWRARDVERDPAELEADCPN
jgi:hypothetical protein